MEERLDNIIDFINTCKIEECDITLQEQIRKSFLDAIMVLCAGTRNESSQKAAEFARKFFPGEQATILTTGEKSNLLGATMANAMAANALDLDDGFSLTKGHPGAALIGALLAASEITKCTYGDFLSALLVGYELCMRQGLVMQDYYSFYHSTGSYAGVGIAASVGKLLGFSKNEIANAMGIADYYAPLVPCMRTVNVPSLNKDGIYLGAQMGMQAAMLAKEGIDGKAMILLDDAYQSYIESLGKKYYIFDLYFKFFSCCRWAQGALAAVKTNEDIKKIDVNNVEKICVYSYGASGELFRGMPHNETEAQYNLRYPLAAYLVHGDFGPMESSLRIDNSKQIIELMEKIEFILEPEYEAKFPAKRYTKVIVKMSDGVEIDTGAVEPIGEPDGSVTLEMIREKSIHRNSLFNDKVMVEEIVDEIIGCDYMTEFSVIRNAIAKLALTDGGY